MSACNIDSIAPSNTDECAVAKIKSETATTIRILKEGLAAASG